MAHNSEWIQEEFKLINITDPRPYKRFLKVSSDLADQPADSIHSASANCATTKAAYRLFDRKQKNRSTNSTERKLSVD